MRTWAPLTVVVAIGLASTAFSAPQRMQIPAWLVDVATAPPLRVAMSLAEARVPAGLEVHDGDEDVNAAPRPGGAREIRPDRTATVDAYDFFSAFDASHAQYRAAMYEGVVVIQPRAQRAPYLYAPAPQFKGPAASVLAAERVLFAPLGGNQPNSVPSSSPSGVVSDGRQDLALTIDVRDRAVFNVLNELAVRVPGDAWLVVTAASGDPVVRRFGVVRASGPITEPITSMPGLSRAFHAFHQIAHDR